MSLKSTFQIVSASLTGAYHIAKGLPNQDRMLIHVEDHPDPERDFILLLLSDGCSLAPHSEIGAEATIEIGQEVFLHYLREPHPTLERFSPEFFHQVTQDIRLAVYRRLIRDGFSAKQVNQTPYLATLIGAVITPEYIHLFYNGELYGLFNGFRFAAGIKADNKPPYLIYGLISQQAALIPAFGIQSYRGLLTDDIDTLAIGTDGWVHFAKAAHTLLPPPLTLVPSVHDLFQYPELFADPYACQMFLHHVSQGLAIQGRMLTCLFDDFSVLLVKRVAPPASRRTISPPAL